VLLRWKCEGNEVILIMTTSTQAILKQALSLDPVERAELIEKLFHSFDKTSDSNVDALWANETESRITAYDAGQICADSAKAVFERINKR
jgi:putative addiction module component (TIGR02574 family)